MTQDFKNMLYIFGCGARGTDVSLEHCVNLSKIRELSLKQECWDIVYCAIRKRIESGDVKIPPEIANKLEKTFMANIARNIQKTEFNKNIINKLRDMGEECCVLKGTTVARLYSMPETRISSDTDIVINPKSEKRISTFLKENGYTVAHRNKNDHHVTATHPIGGLLELHVKFYSTHTEEMVLDGEANYNEDYIILDDGTVAQGINDGLLFLTFHMVKHFVTDCMGIRQVMDLLLYMKEYESEINWDNYNSILKKLRYDKLIMTVKGIGVKYFGFEFSDALVSEEEMNLILDEIEIGGLFALYEETRGIFYHKYTELRNKKNKLRYTIDKYTKGKKSLLKMFFPSLKKVSEYCPYVLKHPYLLPIAWIHRLMRKAIGVINGKGQYILNDTDKAEDMIERRMEIIRKLDMI